MPAFIVKNNPGFIDKVLLTPQDQHHLIKVMRIKRGKKISLTDNKGLLATACVEKTRPLEIKVIKITKGPLPAPITVFLPLIEQDRLEWAIEKLTELNIKTVQLTVTERTQLKKLSSNKMTRLNKIAEAAQKQSLRPWPLIIEAPIKLSKRCQPTSGQKVPPILTPTSFLFRHNQSQGPKELFIGPEGGFTPKEINGFIKLGGEPLSIGDTVLRTETAAVVLVGFVLTGVK